MSRRHQLTQWQGELASRFPDLPAPYVAVLALYSFGVLLAKVSGLSTVCLFLGQTLGLTYCSLRKRLSEFYKDKDAKSGVKHGGKRKDFNVADCFAPLLRWLLSLWAGRHLPLAIDVTNLGSRFHVLCVSVVIRGVGIPIAWKVLLGGTPEAWNPHWKTLLRHCKDAVPDGWTVFVLSDRGLESADLFRFITDLGWHPLMRVKKGGKFRPKGWGHFYHFGDLVRRVGSSLYVQGRAYTGEKLDCTLLSLWSAGHDEPWFILTDLEPEAAEAVWYAFRFWIEQGFKIIKGGGWDWQKTRMEDPERVERLWLVLAVATLWVVALGAEEEEQERIRNEQERLERAMKESEAEAQKRKEQEQRRLEKQKEGQQARRARQEKQRQAAEQQRQRTRRKKAKKMQEKEEDKENQGKKAGQPRAKRATPQQRLHRVDRRGLAVLAALWQDGKNRLPRQLHPEPWPPPSHSVSSLTELEFLSQQT